MDAGTLIDLITVGLLAVGIVLWRSFGAGLEQAARDQAAETVTQLNWPATLQRQLEHLRGTERQELRFESYGKLWAAMRPLAIYDDAPINRQSMTKLSRALSDWYFSEKGGLLLTKHNRDLYFTLQDLVRTTASTGRDWTGERTRDPDTLFDELLRRRSLEGARTLKSVLGQVEAPRWPGEDLTTVIAAWRADIETISADWEALEERDRFAVLQQVSSALRAGLANDVESRLR